MSFILIAIPFGMIIPTSFFIIHLFIARLFVNAAGVAVVDLAIAAVVHFVEDVGCIAVVVADSRLVADLVADYLAQIRLPLRCHEPAFLPASPLHSA